MDKVEVLRILTDLDDTGSIAEVHFDMAELGERAEAIVAQHEEEVADLVAQVAEMGQALEKMRREIQEYRWKPEAYDIDGTMILLEQMVDNALSAAPKMWRVKGRTTLYYDLEVMADDAPDEFRQLLIGRGMFAAWDVIVCPPKGEQPTESEQGGER